MNLDRLCQVGRVVVDGEELAGEMGSYPGGSAANTIYALAKLGVGAGFMGAVGNDAEGRTLIEDLAGVGVDTSHITVKEGPTGAALGLSDGRRRSLYLFSGANSLLSSDDLDLDYLAQARIVHLSSFTNARQRQLQMEAIRHLPPQVQVSLAPGAIYASLGIEELTPILGRCQFMFLNRSELQTLTGERQPEVGAQRVLASGCRLVAVTLGPSLRHPTAYIAHYQEEFWVYPKLIDKKAGDSTGAGDAFVAGFLFGYLTGKRWEECGRIGDLVAQHCVSQMGARSGLPTPVELLAAYRRLYREGW